MTSNSYAHRYVLNFFSFFIQELTKEIPDIAYEITSWDLEDELPFLSTVPIFGYKNAIGLALKFFVVIEDVFECFHLVYTYRCKDYTADRIYLFYKKEILCYISICVSKKASFVTEFARVDSTPFVSRLTKKLDSIVKSKKKGGDLD